MISAALGALATLIVGLAGLGFKIWQARRITSAQKVANVDHAMLQDAVNRPDDDAALKRLRDGSA